MSVTKWQYDTAKLRLSNLRQALSQPGDNRPGSTVLKSANAVIDEVDLQWDDAVIGRGEPGGDLGRRPYCVVLVEAYVGNDGYELERCELEEFDDLAATAERIEEWVFEDLRGDYSRQAFAVDTVAGKRLKYEESRRIEWVNE